MNNDGLYLAMIRAKKQALMDGCKPKYMHVSTELYDYLLTNSFWVTPDGRPPKKILGLEIIVNPKLNDGFVVSE